MSQHLFVRTERQRRFAALADHLAQQFAPQAAEHDRHGTFPYGNFDALRDSGYTRLTVPVDLGGEGASLTELLLAQERMARGDGSTALAIGWHLSLIGKLAETRTWKEQTWHALCQSVVDEGALINSVASEQATGSPSRGGRPTTTARRETGGWWILDGHKTYATLAPVLTHALVSASVSGSEGGGWFLVPMATPGVSVAETWDSMSMRATGSHDLLLSGVCLPDSALVEPFGPGATCQVGAGAGAGWGLHVPAVYLGIAWAARDYALEFARTYRPNSLPGPIGDLQHIQAHLGQMELDLLTARSTLYTVAERWDGEPGQRGALVPLLGAAKSLVTNLALQVVDHAMRVVGASGLSRALPLERFYRDVRAGLHNPPMDDAVLAKLAQEALKEA